LFSSNIDNPSATAEAKTTGGGVLEVKIMARVHPEKYSYRTNVPGIGSYRKVFANPESNLINFRIVPLLFKTLEIRESRKVTG
jgi:hypothetical protein